MSELSRPSITDALSAKRSSNAGCSRPPASSPVSVSGMGRAVLLARESQLLRSHLISGVVVSAETLAVALVERGVFITVFCWV